MLDPKRRADRLHTEYERVRKLHDAGGLITIESVQGDPPDRYLIRFACRGIARVIGDQPVYSDVHQVAINLTATFPTEEPQLEWLTPIFHPNINPNGTPVCIGVWFPGKTLDQLLIMLGEMIQYKNYASHDPLHLEASLWAMQHKELFPVDERSLLEPHEPVSRRKPALRESELEIEILS